MAVEKMRLVSLFGSCDKLNECISQLMNAGCFQPERAYEATRNQKGYAPVSEGNPIASRLRKMTELLDYCGIDYKNLKDSDYVKVAEDSIDLVLSELSNALHDLQTERENTMALLEETEKTVRALEHFGQLDLDLSVAQNSRFIRLKFGRLPAEGYQKLNDYVDNPYLVFHVCSYDHNTYWGVYVTPVDYEEEIDRIFASLFFEQLVFPEQLDNPAKALAQTKQQLAQLKQKLNEIEKNIDWYYEKQGDEFLALYVQIRHAYRVYEYRQYAALYQKKFAVMLGWVPESELKNLIRQFEQSTDFTLTEMNPGEDLHTGSLALRPPTKMKNGKLFRAYEYYVQIFGVPNYREVDPTVFVAITYTLLYGIMFADLGQGIVLAIAAYIMWKKMHMPIGKIILPCGICGALFGLVFGSVFGNEELLNPLYRMLGFSEKPIEVMASATELLAFSIGIGIVLLLMAMLLGIYSNFKKGKTAAALFSANGIAGFVFYASVILLAAGLLLPLKVPTLPVVLVGIVLPLLCMFLQTPLENLLQKRGFQVENVGDYILESVFELFEIVLSFFTNTVSFLRVGAFVLIHAGMMMAFSSLAAIVGGGVPGAIMMVFGNLFVIVLEGLLVGIQVLRLEFYEMFSRFYEGDGQEFKPISVSIQDAE